MRRPNTTHMGFVACNLECKFDGARIARSFKYIIESTAFCQVGYLSVVVFRQCIHSDLGTYTFCQGQPIVINVECDYSLCT